MKAKKILIFIIIILLLIVGSLVIINYKTDIFKTTGQKFWKYFNMNNQIAELYGSEDIQNIKNKRSNTPYEINSSLTIVNKGTDHYMITANTLAQDANDVFTHVDFLYNDRNIVNFNIVKKSNLIAFKNDELANGYIAIKNSGIQQLANEAGIEDTSNIPDNINWFSLLDLLYISRSDQKYVINTYSDLIMKNTSKENYSQEECGVKIDDKVHTAVGYKLQLTENETKQITKEILKYMKDEDARAINLISSKLKLLNLPKKYTEYDYIKEQISKLIDYVDTIETTDNKFIELTAYVEDGNLIQTNIKIKEGSVIKIINKKENNEVYIVQENQDKAFMESSNEIIKYLANIQTITLSNNLSDSKDEIETKFNAKFYNNLVIEYTSRFAFKDFSEKNTDFEDSKKIVLNELESTNLKKLWEILKDRVPKIYEQKKLMLNGQNNNDENSEEIQ